MTDPLIFNPAEGGTLTVPWNKHPGSPGEDWAYGDEVPTVPGNQNTDGSNRTRDVMAGCFGVVKRAGGVFGEVVIKIDNHPLGYSFRTAEHARIKVSIGQRVTPFTIIGEDALFRKDSYFPNGAFRDLHQNMEKPDGSRAPASQSYNCTQAQMKEAMDVQPNQRIAGPTGANARNTPDTSQPVAEGFGLGPNEKGTFTGWKYGETVNNINQWILRDNGKWFWLGGFPSDPSVHDLPDLNTVTVTFESDGGEPVPAPVTVPVNTPIVEPGPVEKEDFIFNGWWSGETLWDFDTPVATSQTLTAGWVEEPTGGGASLDDIAELINPQFAKVNEDNDKIFKKLDALATHLGLEDDETID